MFVCQNALEWDSVVTDHALPACLLHAFTFIDSDNHVIPTIQVDIKNIHTINSPVYKNSTGEYW